MADAPLHYFAGQQALSLRSLDANTRHIAEVERRITQYVGPDMPRFSREGLAFFTPEGAPKLPEGTTEPGPAAKKDTLWAPGILERIAFSEVYDAPCLQAGVAYIPLATQRMSSTAEGATMTAMPGAVRDVVYLDGLSEPLIDRGQVQLPLAQAYVEEEATDDRTTVAGGLCGVSCGGDLWEVRDGIVRVPFATTSQTDEEGNVTPGTPGVLRAVEVVTERQKPAIRNGVLRLPLAHCSTHVGEWDGVTDFSPTAGAIRGISYGSGVEPSIYFGEILLPQPTGGSIEPASFVGTDPTAIAPGGLQGAEYATGITQPQARHGILQLPLADTVTHGTMVAGGVNGIRYGSGVEPSIYFGEILLPQPTGGGSIEPAEFVGTDPTAIAPGGLQGAEYATGIIQPQARHGILQLPLADTVTHGTMVAGGVKGIRYGSGVEPSIYFGEILLPPSGGALQGLCDTQGTPHSWAQVEGNVGSQIPVAGLQLRLAENFYATFVLNAGIKNGHLTFNFTYDS